MAASKVAEKAVLRETTWAACSAALRAVWKALK